MGLFVHRAVIITARLRVLLEHCKSYLFIYSTSRFHSEIFVCCVTVLSAWRAYRSSCYRVSKWMNLSFSVLELCYLVLKMYLAYSVRDFFSFKKLIFLWYLIKKKKTFANWPKFTLWFKIKSVQFSCSVMSDSLRPLESQQDRPPCPSPTSGVYSNSCASSRWFHPAISSSVIPFSCPQSLSASGSFPMSQLFARCGQSIRVSASAPVLPMISENPSLSSPWQLRAPWQPQPIVTQSSIDS